MHMDASQLIDAFNGLRVLVMGDAILVRSDASIRS